MFDYTVNAYLAMQYLNGETIQVKGCPGYENEWCDVVPYNQPTDIYRLSNPLYQFRIKPE